MNLQVQTIDLHLMTGSISVRRRGVGLSDYSKNAHFLGEAKTQDKFVMHCRGSIPFVSEAQAISQIVGEVYEIDDNNLAAIDHLEGCYPKR